jgi:hypothetical protein
VAILAVIITHGPSAYSVIVERFFDSIDSYPKHEETQHTLSSFVRSSNDSLREYLKTKPDLPVAKYDLFSRAVCITADTMNNAREGMIRKLNQVPQRVGDQVIRTAFVEGAMNNYDTYRTCNLNTDSKDADCYYVFYHTQVLRRKTSSCILLTGATLKAGDHFDHYEEIEEEKIVAYTED